MTVQTTDNRVNYLGDASTASFAFNFETDDSSWINTYEDGVLTIKNIEVILNVDQENNPGGSVNFLDAAPAGVPALNAKVTIERIVDLEQGIDYNSYDGFPADTHELGLDKLTYQTQQLDDRMNRAIIAPVTDDGSVDYSLPIAVALEFMRWNAAGNALEGINIADLSLYAVSSFAQTLLDDADADEHWATLMATIDKEVAKNLLGVDISTDVIGTDTYTATLGISAYTNDKTYHLSFANTNTITAPTVNFDTLGAKTIKKADGAALELGVIPDEALVRYDGTDMILLNPVVDIRRTAKAWVQWDGVGTVTIRDSENVSSITDLGTGLYAVNLTNAMADTNFAAHVTTGMRGAFGNTYVITSREYSDNRTVSVTRWMANNILNVAAPAVVDVDYMSVTIFGEQ